MPYANGLGDFIVLAVHLALADRHWLFVEHSPSSGTCRPSLPTGHRVSVPRDLHVHGVPGTEAVQLSVHQIDIHRLQGPPRGRLVGREGVAQYRMPVAPQPLQQRLGSWAANSPIAATLRSPARMAQSGTIKTFA